MNFVYFSEELEARAPGFFSSLCEEPSGEWSSLHDVVAAITRREPVSIRPATESEMNRAEAFVALFEIGLMLGEKLETLLDQNAPEVVRGKITEFRDALESCDASPRQILDKKMEA